MTRLKTSALIVSGEKIGEKTTESLSVWLFAKNKNLPDYKAVACFLGFGREVLVELGTSIGLRGGVRHAPLRGPLAGARFVNIQIFRL